MLKYLVSVTEDLLIVCVLTGFVFGLAWRCLAGHERRVVRGGLAVAWVAAAVLAWLKETTKLVDSGLWNLRFVGIYLVGLVLAFVTLLPWIARRDLHALPWARATGFALIIVGAVGYSAPSALAYPNAIALAVSTVVSTEYFFRMVGWVLGLVLCHLLSFATFKVLEASTERLVRVLGSVACVFCGLVYSGLALRALLTRRIIAQSQIAFDIAVFASNHNLLFGVVMVALAVVATVVLLVRSAHVTEPWDNPAQHRKIRAKWRRRRRWSACALACVLLCMLSVTVFKSLDSREVELSPSEECEVRDDGVYVSLEQVEDGHLHRFTYTTESDVGIRFIVIKKPTGSAYGIGLDACDICGETGYYERDGQVVCKLCDVVMNIQTIGFKGGCNPIVIDYEIADGYIHIPFDTLLEHEVIFTR